MAAGGFSIFDDPAPIPGQPSMAPAPPRPVGLGAGAPPPAAAPATGPRPLFGDLRTKWNGWISVPGNRQALMQFGLNAMQPRPVGQTGLGHLASSVGAGIAAKDRHLAIRAQGQEAIAASQRETMALDIDRQNADTGRINAETQATYRQSNPSEAAFRNYMLDKVDSAISESMLFGEDATALRQQLLNDPTFLAQGRQEFASFTLEPQPGQGMALPTTTEAAPAPIGAAPPAAAAGPTPEQISQAWAQASAADPARYPAVPPEGTRVPGTNYVYRGGAWVNG